MRSPTIAGVEKPEPMSLTCQMSFGPSFGHSLSRPFSSEMPSRCGPRHCGQSVAWLRKGARQRAMGNAARMEALSRLHGLQRLRELRGLNSLSRLNLEEVGFMGGGYGWIWLDWPGLAWTGADWRGSSGQK